MFLSSHCLHLAKKHRYTVELNFGLSPRKHSVCPTWVMLFLCLFFPKAEEAQGFNKKLLDQTRVSAGFTEHLCILQLVWAELAQVPGPPPCQLRPLLSSCDFLHVPDLEYLPLLCGFPSLLQAPEQRVNVVSCPLMLPAPFSSVPGFPFPLISHSSAQGGPVSTPLSVGSHHSHLNSLPQSPTPSEDGVSSFYLSGK